MTFSIVARDPETGDFGIAVASKALAVGAVAPYARAGVGAISTQAAPNVTYGPDGLERLAAGDGAAKVLAALTSADSMAAVRQAGIVDVAGRAATYTGSSCIDWAGGKTVPGATAQGNCLVGPEVVDAMLAAYQAATGSFPRRLLAALQAGDQAGGDSRGRQSAALLVVRDKGGPGQGNDRWVDLRVDDHTAPCTELGRLLAVQEKQGDLLDPDHLKEIGSALAGTLKSTIRSAMAPKTPEPPATPK
jgi:uncharacterized Ntn-hydrolase superfamily protein